MKHINQILWLILSLSFPTYAVEIKDGNNRPILDYPNQIQNGNTLTNANDFNDGNTVGGFFTRMATNLHAVLGGSLKVLGLLGIFTVASGLTFIGWANKRQISPRFGIVLCISGFALMSPKACSNMATQQVLQYDTQVVTDVLDQNNDFISPNEY